MPIIHYRNKMMILQMQQEEIVKTHISSRNFIKYDYLERVLALYKQLYKNGTIIC